MESLGHTHDGREKLFSLDGHQRPSGHPLRPAKTQHDDQLQVRQVFMTLNYRRVVFYCVVTLLVACCIAFFYFFFTFTSQSALSSDLHVHSTGHALRNGQFGAQVNGRRPVSLW